MIYMTGDCHGDFRRFRTDIFPEQKEMTKEDFVIVCGDFGLWHDTKEERYWLNWLNDKPFTTLFIAGNHDNFDRLYSDEFPVEDFHGGKVQKIRNSVLHLMRGHIYELCGKKIFAFGGASSHDVSDGILDRKDFSSDRAFKTTIRKWAKQKKDFRVNHLSWWDKELPSQEEMDFGIQNLKKHGNKVDFIVSHCGPQHVVSVYSRGGYKLDYLTRYFNNISYNVDFSRWFFGHYHDNKVILGKYIVMYEQITRCA